VGNPAAATVRGRIPSFSRCSPRAGSRLTAGACRSVDASGLAGGRPASSATHRRAPRDRRHRACSPRSSPRSRRSRPPSCSASASARAA
jgi:hypothetical protein